MTLSELYEAINVELKLDSTIARSDDALGATWTQGAYMARVDFAPKPYLATLVRRGGTRKPDIWFADEPLVAKKFAKAIRAHFGDRRNTT